MRHVLLVKETVSEERKIVEHKSYSDECMTFELLRYNSFHLASPAPLPPTNPFALSLISISNLLFSLWTYIAWLAFLFCPFTCMVTEEYSLRLNITNNCSWLSLDIHVLKRERENMRFHPIQKSYLKKGRKKINLNTLYTHIHWAKNWAKQSFAMRFIHFIYAVLSKRKRCTTVHTYIHTFVLLFIHPPNPIQFVQFFSLFNFFTFNNTICAVHIYELV